jgi:hypothetical protein
VLAYHLLVSIEKTLLDAGIHTSWATVRETLKTHPLNTVVLPAEGGLTLRIRRGSHAGASASGTLPDAGHRFRSRPTAQDLVAPGGGVKIVTKK